MTKAQILCLLAIFHRIEIRLESGPGENPAAKASCPRAHDLLPGMKTMRFEKLVASAGKPEPYLVLMDPANDRTLQAAVKANRVVTVHQPSTGTRTDYGAVGFDPGPSRQYLLFPRAVGRFKARRIVGIKYDLLAGDTSTRRKKRPAPARKTPRPAPELRLVEKPETPAKKTTPPKSKTSATARREKQERAKRARAKQTQAREAQERREKERGEQKKARALATLTTKVRRALHHLEAGHLTPALSLLKQALQTQI